MTVEIISLSISTTVWDRIGVKFTTPGSAVRHLSAARHVTVKQVCPPVGVLLTKDGHISSARRPRRLSDMDLAWAMMKSRIGIGDDDPFFKDTVWHKVPQLNQHLLVCTVSS